MSVHVGYVDGVPRKSPDVGAPNGTTHVSVSRAGVELVAETLTLTPSAARALAALLVIAADEAARLPRLLAWDLCRRCEHPRASHEPGGCVSCRELNPHIICTRGFKE